MMPHPEAVRTKHQEISAVTQEANDKRLQAIRDYEVLQGQVWSAHQDVKDLNIRIGERQQKLDQLVREVIRRRRRQFECFLMSAAGNNKNQ